MSKSGLGKFIIGAGIGFGIGLLVANKPGKETRQDIKDKFKELEEKFKTLDYDDLKKGALNKLEELKLKIQDLDQEKLENIAREKIDDIKLGIANLTKSVKKKSAPIIKKIADELSVKIDSLNKEEKNI